MSPRTKPHDSVVTIRDCFENSLRGGHCRGKVGNLSRFISLAVLHIVERKKNPKNKTEYRPYKREKSHSINTNFTSFGMMNVLIIRR